MRDENFSQSSSPTKYVVAAVIGLALTAMIFSVMNWRWALAVTVILLYEAWTLVNKYPNDTISEIIWLLSRRPFIPWMFGVGTGWALASGTISNPWLVGGLLFLQGHFFFQRFGEEKE